MSEMPCGSGDDDLDHRMAHYASQLEARGLRIARFHRRVKEVSSGEAEPRADDYMYENPDLAEAYAILEIRYHAAVRAIISLAESEHDVDQLRHELHIAHIADETERGESK